PFVARNRTEARRLCGLRLTPGANARTRVTLPDPPQQPRGAKVAVPRVTDGRRDEPPPRPRALERHISATSAMGTGGRAADALLNQAAVEHLELAVKVFGDQHFVEAACVLGHRRILRDCLTRVAESALRPPISPACAHKARDVTQPLAARRLLSSAL